MSAFGWSYPPGCSGTPYDDDDESCSVCGAQNPDYCVCRICPECGTAGDSDCYRELANRFARHHPPCLTLTATQYRSRAAEQSRLIAENDRLTGYVEHLEDLPDDF